MGRRAILASVGAALIVVAVAAVTLIRARAARERDTFVGAARCATCHADEYRAWRGSQHAAAMQAAGPRTVLGHFDGARLTVEGLTSTFTQRGGSYVVNTEGDDGARHDFDVRYTFGVYPLQQYLVRLAGGRLQALPFAWDARPASEGGQRWFSLDPTPRPRAGSEGHWAAPQWSWNFMCADCHSTGVRKNYDARADSFHTTFAEVDVACEACHGPSSRHARWAGWPRWLRRLTGTDAAPPARLTERRGVRWATNAAGTLVQRSVPRTTDREVQTCAQCHARRVHVMDGYTAGASLLDYYEPELLVSPLYYPDGQQRSEVYDYGSFLQSRMYAAGVTCSDCHEPHSAHLRRPGNQVCTQCHVAARYDTSAHHFHPRGSAGAACAACHLPDTTYMQIDPRHDHSIRVPRPDLSVRLGVPNACNRCHTDRDARWALQVVTTHFGHAPSGFQRFADAFAADDRAEAGATGALGAVASDQSEPAFVRASALTRLAARPGPVALDAARRAARDASPLVRRGALDILDAYPAAERLAIATPLLADTTRIVRLKAAWVLAPVADSLAPTARAAFARAAEEFVASQRYNADRASSRLTLGAFDAARGQLDSAAAEFRAAVRIDPRGAQGYINLAAVLLAQHRAVEAERLLRDALTKIPDDAELRRVHGEVLGSLGRLH